MKFLMSQPMFYGIEYEINPWMNRLVPVDHAKAVRQWDQLHSIIKRCGAEIQLVTPVSGWPDMVFTANAGLWLHENKLVLSHFKYPERQGETPYFKSWFRSSGFDIVYDPSMEPNTPHFEGAGDALFADSKLFVGYGIRSDRNFYPKLSFLKTIDFVYCELVDPYFYHIDTCFCPLTENLALWYSEAFSKESQKNIQEKIECISVNKEEAKRFACNAVIIDKQVILPTECPQITRTLENLGFKVYACDMSEYIKAGGACKCLTLRIS